MRTVSQWMQFGRKYLGFFEEVINRSLVTFHITPDREDCKAKFEYRGSPETNTMLTLLASYDMSTVVETYLTANTLAHGSKVYRPAQLDCEALEQISVNIPLEDYWQPYPTMVIELPPDYAKKRIVPCAQAGQAPLAYHLKPPPLIVPGHAASWSEDVLPPNHEGRFVVAHFDHEKHLLMLGLYFDSTQVITRFMWTRKPDETFEDITAKLPILKGSLATNDDEQRAANCAFRIALNACLLMKEFGCKKIGTDNPSYYHRVEQRLAKAKKRHDQKMILSNERELRLIPVLYGFGQEVRLYTEERNGGRGESEGLVATHWRKGHWTNQPYGPKQSLRKRILLKPILVNKHLLGA